MKAIKKLGTDGAQTLEDWTLDLDPVDAKELDAVVGGFQLNQLNIPVLNLLGQVGISGIGGIGQNFGLAQINNFN